MHIYLRGLLIKNDMVNSRNIDFRIKETILISDYFMMKSDFIITVWR